MIYVYNEKNFGGFGYANAQWSANQWYNLKVEITENTITYYLNNAVVYTGANTSKANVNGMNFLHNNFGGSAYYDNIKINGADLAVNSVNKGKLAVYPNPVKSNLNFSLPNGEKISRISIHNMAGQKVLAQTLTNATINLETLQAGTYIVTVTNAAGTSYSSKFIKE